MSFTSLPYLLFLSICLLLYFILPPKLRNSFLLAASYFFYICWQPVYALLLLASTVATYACALRIERGGRTRRLWLIAGLFWSLLILFFFKYFNFAAQLLTRTLGFAGISFDSPVSALLLPVGISFYTFQIVGYLIDVYRGKLRAERSLIDYALFAAFFPPLVSGPIGRAERLLPQFKTIQTFRMQRIFEGALLLLWGIFKKLVIADRLAILVNTAFGAPPGDLGGLPLAVAAAAFSVQLYCDFSAYTDLARGSAHMFGLDLMQNFDAPLLASSIKDFWRRWHISLSTWFRDYLYFPLGGSRCAQTWRRYFNLMIVFLVSGLWHGAALTFLVWGFLHGLFQIVSVITLPWRSRLLGALRIKDDHRAVHILRILFTFALVTLAFVFFRAGSITSALHILKTIALSPLSGSFSQLGFPLKNLLIVLVAVSVLFAVDILSRKRNLARQIAANIPLRYTAYFLLLVAILIFGCYGDGFDPQEFIYFQF